MEMEMKSKMEMEWNGNENIRERKWNIDRITQKHKCGNGNRK